VPAAAVAAAATAPVVVGIEINPAMKRHFELEIRTLQDAPRDADRLRAFANKAETISKATRIEDIQTLVMEIEMLLFRKFSTTP